jgi:hypothetical protein
MEQAASQLTETSLRTFADYTSEIKATIKNFCDSLQNRSVRLARNRHSGYGPAETDGLYHPGKCCHRHWDFSVLLSPLLSAGSHYEN